MRPIRIHLVILVLGAMLPPALLTSVLVWRTFATNRTVAERRLLDSARVDALALNREFEGIVSTLTVLATSPALDRDDLEAFHQEARRVQTTQPGWSAVVVTSVEGGQLLSTRVPWGGPLVPVVEPESLRRVISSQRPAVGPVRPDARGGTGFLFAVRVPVSRHERLKYVLTAVVDVASLDRVVPRQLPGSEEWTRNILDPEGTIAVRTRGGAAYVGTRATETFLARMREAPEIVSRETTRDGMSVYAADSRSDYGWTAIVVVPQAVLDAPLRSSMTALLTGGVLLMLCGLGAVLLVSQRLSGDLAAATAAAEAVAEGRPAPRAQAHTAETLHLQRSLASTASLLEERLRERDEEIRRAEASRAEAEAANRTKDQFLAVLGHELRNPLAPALTALELMKRRDPAVFTREREVLERQVAHMLRLVNDLLDVSRLTRGQIHLERRPFELREAVDRAVDMARPLLAQKHHLLEVSVPASGLTIDGDSDRIVQVLANLLTNAAKYTPAGGRLALAASPAGGFASIACEDSGPGVAPALVPHLFDTFAQGPRSLDRREGGLGLGLALARRFTELHGGSIRFENRAEGGSRFVVQLPLASPAVPEPGAPVPDAVVRGERRRILLVDDNADARVMLGSALDDAGHTVAVAGDGEEAMTTAAAFRPEVAVLDIGLPGMDGYELARRLRADYPGLRLVALTGYGRSADLEAAAAAGFDAHCTKPVATAALLDTIARPVAV